MYCVLLTMIVLISLAGCSASRPHPKADRLPGYKVMGKWYHPLKTAKGYEKKGVASWYGTKFHGRKTANGEIYNMHAMTAAHTILPLGTRVRVIHLKTGTSVVVRINDRGPFVKNRIIDLSYAAAKALGIDKLGTGRVEVLALDSLPGKPSYALQVGSFSRKTNASALARTLAQTHCPVGVISESGMFKVHVGRFATHTQAGAMKKKLSSMGYKAFFVSSTLNSDGCP